MKLKSGSWHHRLAAMYGPLSGSTSTTSICVYTTSVILGTIMVAFLSFVGGLIVSMLAMPFVYVVAGIVHGFVEPGDVTQVGILVWSAVICLCILGVVEMAVKHYFPRRSDANTEPGFVSQAWKSWRKKVCWKVEIV